MFYVTSGLWYNWHTLLVWWRCMRVSRFSLSRIYQGGCQSPDTRVTRSGIRLTSTNTLHPHPISHLQRTERERKRVGLLWIEAMKKLHKVWKISALLSSDRSSGSSSVRVSVCLSVCLWLLWILHSILILSSGSLQGLFRVSSSSLRAVLEQS